MNLFCMNQMHREIPLVSVIIPCYNHEMYVQECIQSVIDQDYLNIELIIIDDGSNDSSVSKILEMILPCEKRFTRFEFRHRENRGLTATLNEALDWSNGKYFSPIASDDILLPNKISFLVPLLNQDSTLAAVFGGVQYIDGSGKLLGIEKNMDCDHTFHELIMGGNIPSAPASVIRKESVLEIGKFDPAIGIEDWFLWLKLTEKGWRLRTIKTAVVKYRRHLSNTTNDYKKMHINRMFVMSHFKDHALYNRAVSELYLKSARESATYEFIYPIKMLMSARFARLFDKILCLIKISTPKWIIVLSRQLRKI